MKRITTLFILLTVTLITSCSDDDATAVNENPCATVIPAPYTGTWNLVNVSGSIAGVSHDFEPGEIKWTFEFCPNSGVTVVNNNDDELVEDFLETGSYNISFTEYDADAPGCPQYWIIGGTDFGCLNYSDAEPNTLTLTQAVADGYQLTFTR
jgi:hypothetical protein